jgi:hypothetical protein
MSIDRIVLAFAGTVILLSLALSQIHSPYWLSVKIVRPCHFGRDSTRSKNRAN